MKKKVIVFAPHPDDETLGCGGTIAKRLSEGYEVLIVFMTNGENAHLGCMRARYSEPTPQELKNIRKEEAKRAAKVLGVQEENLLFLDFEDGMLERDERRAQEKVIEILSKTSPAEVYFPYEKDSHRDHRVTNRIVQNSISKLRLYTVKYQYSILQMYLHIDPLKNLLFNLLRHFNLLRYSMINVDISMFLPLKKRAIKRYRSQTAIIFNRQKKPVLKSNFIKRFLKNEEKFFVNK